MHDAPDEWVHLIQSMISDMDNNRITSVLGKIGVAACVYNIWRERNQRLFQNVQRSEEILINIIKEDLKWKLMSLRMKNSANVRRILNKWNIPLHCVCV